MTRFARAQGSKSSNERTPEDGTPWEVIKAQLEQAQLEKEDNKKRKDAEKQRQENYDNFIKEQRIQKKKTTWCDFPVPENTNSNEMAVNVSDTNDCTQNVSKKKRANKGSPDDSINTIKSKKPKYKKVNNVDLELSEDNPSALGNDFPKKKKRKSDPGSNVNMDEKEKSVDPSFSPDISVVSNKIMKVEHKNINVEDNTKLDQVKLTTEDIPKSLSNDSPKKKRKKKNKTVTRCNDNVNVNESFSEQDVLAKKEKKNTKGDNVRIEQSEQNATATKTGINVQNSKKNKYSKAVRRKPIDDRSFQFIINGKEIELVRFDGFPIMKKDADRLKDLRDNMLKKGIPKSEVQHTMKLERRRAEKALARLKRDVCYNCRKGGHNLSDCPELKSKIPGEGIPEGICFKCGSTEHRSFDCKVQRDDGFRFATCFICKEQGHIARQCPDNPKGLYPNGGSCNLCGDITHLRKDCPTTKETKQASSIRLETLNSTDYLEGDHENNAKMPIDGNFKKPKKIKF